MTVDVRLCHLTMMCLGFPLCTSPVKLYCLCSLVTTSFSHIFSLFTTLIGSLCEGPNGKRSIQTETALLTNIPFCDAISILRHTCGRFVQQQAQASQLHYHTTANAAHRASAIIQQQGNSMYLQNIATIEEKTKLSRQNFRLMQDVDLLRRENHKLRNKLTRTSTTGPTQFMDASSTRSNIDDHAKVDTSGHSISSFPTTKRQKRTEEDVETAEI